MSTATAQQSTPQQSTAKYDRSLQRVVSWVLTNRYRGYEPADGNSSVLSPLTGGRIFPMRLLQQLVLRAPFNIRPWLGVAPHESAIGRGYMAWGYLTMYRRMPDAQIRDEAIACLDWLVENRAQRYDEFCWGGLTTTRRDQGDAPTENLFWYGVR